MMFSRKLFAKSYYFFVYLSGNNNIMNINQIEKKKYGIDIWSYLYAIDAMNSDYDGWTYNAKTPRTRKKHFLSQFGGPKENYQSDNICLN